MEVFPRRVADLRDESRGQAGHPGFARPGASMGIRGEERGIRLNHDAVGGDEARRGLDFGRVLIRHDTCERDVCPKVQDLAGVVSGARKAMKDKSIARERSGGENRNEIIKGLAAVNDNGLGYPIAGAGFDEGQLLFEDLPLRRRKGFFVMIVKAQLTPGNTLGVTRRDLHLGPFVRAFIAVERVHTGRGPNSLVSLGNSEAVECVVGGSGDCDTPANPVLLSAGKHGPDATGHLIGLKIREGQMAMCINHSG